MYKVVIVDDEPVIAQGMTKLVPWEKYDCTVVAAAYSGKDGMEVIRRERPDIVFSDIAMPGLDGLKMIAAMKVEFPDMQVSILTGYRDFDYCQEALRLGAARFLLKPSNMAELEEALAVMVERIKKHTHTEKTADAQGETEELSGSEDEQAGSFIVKNAIQYMEENYQKKISLSLVAEKTFVSQWHLSKLLNRQEGKNFSEILNQIRIDHAKELLKDPAYRIADISEKVGFTDVAHFSRVFKKMEGISANEYRNTRI